MDLVKITQRVAVNGAQIKSSNKDNAKRKKKKENWAAQAGRTKMITDVVAYFLSSMSVRLCTKGRRKKALTLTNLRNNKCSFAANIYHP